MFFDFLHGTVRNQYLAMFTVNLISISHGSIAGWTSPALLTLLSHDTPLASGVMTTEQVSWLVSSISFGTVTGIPFSEFVAKKVGNRTALAIFGVPHVIWWALVEFGDAYYHLIIGRVIVGITAGAIWRVLPLFNAEISQPEIRGIFGSMSALIYNLGVLLGFILGGYVPYHLIPISAILPVICSLLIIVYIPNTPQYLLSKGKQEAAFQSLLFYRTVNSSESTTKRIEEEFSDIKELQAVIHDKKNVSWRAFFRKEARFAMTMSIFLSLLMQFTGHFPLMQFTATIFVESGSNFSPADSAIIVALLQIIGSYVSVILVDRAGRKILLIVSCLGTAISLGAIGCYSFLDTNGFEVHQFNWIPVVCFSAGIFLLSLGIIGLPVIVMTEIMPPEIKNTGLTIAMVINPILSFFVGQAFPLLLVKIHLYGVMWLFASSSLVGILVIAIFLPETKGKNLNKL